MKRLLSTALAMVAVSAVVLVAAEASAQHRPAKGSFSVYGSVAAIQYLMDDVNDVLREIEDEQRERGASSEHGVYDSGFQLGGGLSYQLSERLSIGVDFSRGSSDIGNSDFIRLRDPEQDGRIVQDDRAESSSDIEFQDLTGSVVYWLPLDEGLFVGAEGGVIWGDGKSRRAFTDFLEVFEDYEQSSEWSGTGPSLSLFGGYNFRFSSHVFIAFKGGYQYRKITSMTGCIQHSLLQPGECVTVDGANIEGTLEDLGFERTFFDQNNESLDFDFSGAFFNMSIGWSFGDSSD